MVAQSLHGPWLNLEEITRKTGLVNNEILYAIQTQHITPVFHTDNRPFLAYSRQDSSIVGHACFRYSGPVALDTGLIRSIVRNGHVLLNRQPVKLLCEQDIFEWSTDFPYQGALPNGIIDRWEPCSFNGLSGQEWEIMLQPCEYSARDWAESMLVELIPKHYDEEDFFNRYSDHYLVRSPSDSFAYGIEYHHQYTQQDFRFPKAALERLLNNAIPPKAPVISEPLSQQRTNDLHKVIVRLLSHHKDAQIGTLWNALRRDIQQTNRDYDNDHIITKMSHAEIHWVSGSGASRTLKKNSFKTRVSKLRKVGLVY